MAGAIVVVVVIAASTGGSGGLRAGRGAGASRAQRESYCVVRAGDTFAAIAVEARVPETRLAELNPNLDQFSIQPENCVNLVPKGCKELAGGGHRIPAPSRLALPGGGALVAAAHCRLGAAVALALGAGGGPPPLSAKAWYLVDARDGARLAARTPAPRLRSRARRS